MAGRSDGEQRIGAASTTEVPVAKVRRTLLGCDLEPTGSSEAPWVPVLVEGRDETGIRRRVARWTCPVLPRQGGPAEVANSVASRCGLRLSGGILPSR